MLWRTGASLDPNTATDIAVGRVVRRNRQRLKLTQEQVAWAVDMSRVYLSEIERGHRAISFRVFLRLAFALGMAATVLVAEVEEDVQRLLQQPTPPNK